MKKYGIGGNNVNCPVYGVGGVLSSCKTYGNNSVIADLSPKLWCRQGVGITTDTGVSQWDDQSGNGNHLKQATGANQPALQGDGSILFDGIAHFLKADAFTFVQPETIYVLGKQITWTSGDRWFDGNTLNVGTMQQITATPELRIFAGNSVGNISLALDTYGVVSVVINSTSSLIQLNNNSPVTGDAGSVANMGGLTLGASGGSTDFGNIQVKEILAYSDLHDDATRQKVISFLQNI